MNLNEIEVDVSRLRGVWWDFHTKMPCPSNKPHAEHFCVLLVPPGPEHGKVLSEILEPHAMERRRGTIAHEVIANATGVALGRTVLRDWRNAELGGKPCEFSEAQSVEFMTDPRWMLLRKFVENAATNEGSLLHDLEVEARGN